MHYVCTPVGVQQTGKIDELCVCKCVCVCVCVPGGGQGCSKSSTLALDT